jgi:hypothetical protein
VAALGASSAAAAQAQTPSGKAKVRPRIMFYHDGRHPLIYMYEPPMQKEEYESAVDELAGTPVQAIMFGLGDGRTVLHDTKVGELWGHRVKKWPHAIFRRAHQNARMLIDAGHDPLRVVCDRAHAKGMLLYPTLLMQMGSGSEEDVRTSNFRLRNRHLEIGARGGIDPSFPKGALQLADYKLPEVRRERFALIEETLKRYPVDGFELQLNYGSRYFRPDELDEGRKIMTEWIAEIHRAVVASGADRELVVRVPGSLEGSYSIGLDVREWMKRKIVDVVVPQIFGGPERIDVTLDVRAFVEAAKGTGTRIHPALQSDVDSDRTQTAPIEMVRAAACNYWAQGVDGLYLAHWFNRWPYQAPFYEILRELPHADIMAPKDKFYSLPAASYRYPNLAEGLEAGMSVQLPKPLAEGKSAAVTLPVSDDLKRWGKAGRVHEVLLRVRLTSTTELDRFEFRFNGKPLAPEGDRRINEMYKMSAPRYRVTGYWYIWRLDPARWPEMGGNKFEVTLTRRDPDLIPEITLRDVELEIKYKMGKNFHRGQDPDLGPAQGSSPN